MKPELGQLNDEPEMENSIEMREIPVPTHMEEDITVDQEKKNKKNRVPRRVIHFSDGVIEEFSTDSEEEEERRNTERLEQGNNTQNTLIRQDFGGGGGEGDPYVGLYVGVYQKLDFVSPIIEISSKFIVKIKH